MFKFSFNLVCEVCGWSEGADHLPEVFVICEHCSNDAVDYSDLDEVLFEDEDEVCRWDGLR